MMIDIIGLLNTNGYILCNKQIIKMFGTDCAVILGELCAEYKFFEVNNQLENDMFYSTIKNIEENTGLSEYYQREAINKLKKAGIISVEKKGMPAKNYFKIHTEKLCEIFTTETVPSASHRQAQVIDTGKLNNKTINNNINNISLSNDNDNYSGESEFESKMYSPKKKKRGKSLYEKCVDYIDEFTDLPDLRQALIEYLIFRLSVKDKPLYGLNQWKSMLNKLDKVVEESHKDYIDIVQQSIDRAWLNFYPINVNKKDVFAEGNGLSCEQSTDDEETRKEILAEQGKRTEF